MKELKYVIGENILALRTKSKMTQSELAKELNYTDKSVSKWEHGEVTPPVDIMKSIADYFGVTLDYLVTENPSLPKNKYRDKSNRINKLVIVLLAISIVWLTATVLFVYLSLAQINGGWQAFIWAVPVCFIIAIVFNSIFGKPRHNYIYISFLIWSLLAAVYVLLLKYNLWIIFIIGIPLQFGTVLWSKLKISK